MYTRRLSPDEYGDFALAQSALSFLPLIFTLGLISAVPKFYFAESDRTAGRASAGAVALWLVVFTLVLALATCVGVAVFADPGSGGLLHRYELTCVCVAAAGSAISSVPDIVLRSEQRPYPAALYQLLQFGLQLSLGLLFVLGLGRGLRGAIEAVAVAYAVSGMVGLVFILFSLRGRLDKRILLLALPFALPFMAHFLANWAQMAADRWTMKAFHLEAALGGYVLAVQLTSPIAMIVAAWNDVESARMGEISRASGVLGLAGAARRVRMGYFLVSCLPAVGIVVCLPVLSAFVGDRFVWALRLVPLMALFSVIEAMYVPSSNILYYASRTRTIAMVTISSALLNITLNLGLIPFFGVHGAMAARLLTAITRSAVIWRAAQWSLRTDGSSSAPPSVGEVR